MSRRLGVVMPIFNGAATLGDTLASVGAGEGIEIVAVCQASEDRSREILEEHQSRLPIRILDTGAGSNWMANTNLGIEALGTSHVTMLHQDDIWLPGRAQAALNLVERFPDCRLWVQAARYIDGGNRRVGRFAPAFGPRPAAIPSEQAIARLLVQNTVGLPGAIFRREDALAGGGLSEDLWYTADWDFWLRLAALGPVGWDPEERVGFRLHLNSQTVRRSYDVAGFEHQLRVPYERHAATLAPERRAGVEAMARAARRVNVYLAARYHRAPVPAWPVLRDVLALGPLRWAAFLRDSQILPRIISRLRVLRRPSAAG